jgi:hypothetical protein
MEMGEVTHLHVSRDGEGLEAGPFDDDRIGRHVSQHIAHR